MLLRMLEQLTSNSKTYTAKIALLVIFRHQINCLSYVYKKLVSSHQIKLYYHTHYHILITILNIKSISSIKEPKMTACFKGSEPVKFNYTYILTKTVLKNQSYLFMLITSQSFSLVFDLVLCCAIKINLLLLGSVTPINITVSSRYSWSIYINSRPDSLNMYT